MNSKLLAALAVGLLCAAPAFSAPITLDFEGAGSFTSIDGFYNGGVDGSGGSGPNLGISFGGDALALSNDELGPYYSNAPTSGTIMAPVGADAALNLSMGFGGSASFYYSASENASVSLFSGVNGTGALLGIFNLIANAQNGCSDTAFCHWDIAFLSFSGVAQSIQFGGAANVAGFDNVTITPVPLPAVIWMMLSGLVGLGGTMVCRKKFA